MTGAHANTQRETTPLRRDNSRIRPDRASAPPGPDQATRPAFAAPQVHQSTSGQPVPRPKRVTPTGWLLRGLVLLAISLVSGLIWLLLKPGGDDAAAPPPPDQPLYQFTPIRREEAFQGCQNVSTDKIKNFFQKQECEHLTRALYRTRLHDGTEVLTSLVTVLLPDAGSAQQLNDLTTRDGTGNIRDLVDDERDGTKDLPRLDDDAYASGRQDRLVVIGDSAYVDKPTPNQDPALRDVTMEALKLGWPQDQANR